MAYQNEAYARSYVEDVKAIYDKEATACPGKSAFSQAVARYLYKLMAYKDEYEVARLSLKPEQRQAMRDQFGAKAKVRYHLQPPDLEGAGFEAQDSGRALVRAGVSWLAAHERLARHSV